MSKKKRKTSTKRTAKAGVPKANDPNIVPLKDVMPPKQQAAKGKRPKGTGKPTAKADARPKKLSLLDAAAQVLKAKGEPMRCKDMVAAVVEKGLWTTNAPTPEATLYSGILREMKKGRDSRLAKTGRGTFTLNHA